jgi:hypothetical protein
VQSDRFSFSKSQLDLAGFLADLSFLTSYQYLKHMHAAWSLTSVCEDGSVDSHKLA